MTIYFSNRLEILFSHLEKNLFADRSALFAKRLLIVSSRSIDTWIRLKMASDPRFKIATGFKTLFLNEAVEYLGGDSSVSNLELAFKIESEVRHILANESLDIVWEPLIAYLTSHEERLMPLCLVLSVHFARYALYRKQGQKGAESWEKKLWQRVFFEKQSTQLVDFKGSIHLFGFNHLSDFHFSFFQQLKDVSFYHLSPCKEFWSDIKNDREIGTFLKSKKLKTEVRAHLEELLADQNRILANLGKVQRDFAYKVENRGLDTIEDYDIDERKTALAQLQREILLLEKAEDKIEDDTMQLHAFPTKYREIEGLYNYIAGLNRGVDTIRVFAPDIDCYEPYIRAVFEGKIEYQIDHVTQKNSLIRGLILLLELEKKRWSSIAILEIFTHPPFQEKWHLHREDLKKIEKWIHYGQIRWGYNKEHAQKLVRQRNKEADLEDGHSTWLCGIDRLLCSMAYADAIAFTEAELLQKMIVLLDLLYKALQEQSEKTISAWCAQILTLASTFFVCKEGERKALENIVEELQTASRMSVTLFNLETFLHLFKKLAENLKETAKGKAIEAVQFCTLLPSEALPATHICLIGMNLASFPRKTKGSHLDLLKKEGGHDFAPTSIDLDKALFLEMLLSARESLYISYIGEMPLATLVDLLDIKKCIEHPLLNVNCTPTHLPQLLMGHPEGMAHPKGKQYLDVKDWLRCFVNPLKPYFREHLNLKFWKEEEIKEEEEFVLSSWMVAELRKKSLSQGCEVIVENAVKKGTFPLHAFREYAHLKIADEIKALHNALRHAHLEGHDLKKYQLEPFIRVALHEEGEVFLTGDIEGVTQEGLFVFEKCQMAKAIRHFPSFLVLNHIQKTPLIFGKDGKVKLPFFEDPEPLLKTFLEYYFFCRSNPSFLFPDWIEPILQKDVKKLAKVMQEASFEGSFAEELKFALRNQMVPKPQAIIETWGNWAERLYREMKEAWF